MSNSTLAYGRSNRGYATSRPIEADPGLLRRLAAALAAPVVALAAGVPLRSAHLLIPDGEE